MSPLLLLLLLSGDGHWFGLKILSTTVVCRFAYYPYLYGSNRDPSAPALLVHATVATIVDLATGRSERHILNFLTISVGCRRVAVYLLTLGRY